VLVGSASVYIARQEVVNSASLSYGLFFLGLYIAAHMIARVTVPNADPYLLPMAGLLTGVGLTESQARNKLGQVRTYTSDFRPMKNVLAGRNERSLYKLVVDAATDRVVGIHMIGPDAPEILQAAAVAVKAGLKKADFDATVALHPTMSEELVLMR